MEADHSIILMIFIFLPNLSYFPRKCVTEIVLTLVPPPTPPTPMHTRLRHLAQSLTIVRNGSKHITANPDVHVID